MAGNDSVPTRSLPRMLEHKIYTPRSSFEHQRDLPGFLRLPMELRIQIYEAIFADIKPKPLLIRRYPGHPWLYRRPKSSKHIPGVLFLNKQISIEARDVLHRTCFDTSDQPISIEHVRCFPLYTHPVPEPTDWNNRCTYSSIREIKAVLQSLPRIRLEVRVSDFMPHGSYGQFDHTVALLRWIRAVLNERPFSASFVHVPLQSFDVIFWLHPDIPARRAPASASEGDVRAIVGVKSVVEEPQVWLSTANRRPDNRTKTKVFSGERIDIHDAPMEGLESEAKMWSALEKTSKKVLVEDESIRKHEAVRGTGWDNVLGRKVWDLFGR